MTTDELQRYYTGIDIDDATVHRLVDTALAASVPPRRAPRLLIAVAVTAVIVAAILLAVRVRAHHDAAPARPTVVVPTPRNGAVTGTVVDQGKPVAGTKVWVEAWPNGQVQSRLKRGSAVRLGQAGSTVTDEHGGFVVHVSPHVLVKRYLEGTDIVNVDINFDTGTYGSTWFFPLHLRPDHLTAPFQIMFDIGAHRVRIGRGHWQRLPN